MFINFCNDHLLISLGILALLIVVKGMFSFSTESDAYFKQAYGEIGQPFVDALKEDRRAMYTSDLLRSMGLILTVFAIFWLFIKKILKIVFIKTDISMFLIFIHLKIYFAKL